MGTTSAADGRSPQAVPPSRHGLPRSQISLFPEGCARGVHTASKPSTMLWVAQISSALQSLESMQASGVKCAEIPGSGFTEGGIVLPHWIALRMFAGVFAASPLHWGAHHSMKPGL